MNYSNVANKRQREKRKKCLHRSSSLVWCVVVAVVVVVARTCAAYSNYVHCRIDVLTSFFFFLPLCWEKANWFYHIRYYIPDYYCCYCVRACMAWQYRVRNILTRCAIAMPGSWGNRNACVFVCVCVILSKNAEKYIVIFNHLLGPNNEYRMLRTHTHTLTRHSCICFGFNCISTIQTTANSNNEKNKQNFFVLLHSAYARHTLQYLCVCAVRAIVHLLIMAM